MESMSPIFKLHNVAQKTTSKWKLNCKIINMDIKQIYSFNQFNLIYDQILFSIITPSHL